LAAVDPEDPASWNRYAYACDPLDVVDPTGACTINVSVSGMGSGDPALASVEKRVNQIFGATPTSSGDVTQVAFDSGGSVYKLELSNRINSALLGKNPPASNRAIVYVGSVSYYAQKYARGQINNAIGATAAHELLHAITGLPDETLTTAPSSPDILTADLAMSLGLQDEVMFSLTSSAPSLYSKLSTAQADRLYSICKKLQAPKSVGAGGGGGGGFNASGSNDNWWFWYVEFLNGQPQPTPKPDPCPNGDCRH
jgi:hypothetical protein